MGGRITALTAQKRNPQRINVYLDGEFAFGLSRLAAAWLQVGQELSDEKVASLQAQDADEVVYQQALRLLEFRPRSATEIRRHLSKKGIEEPLIVEALERLQRSGLVDDDRLAQAWVENRSAFRPRGRRALAAEMRQHGLPDQAIQDALQGLDEAPLALEAARKHARRLSGLEWPDFQRKLSGFLARRGFSYDAAGPVVKQVWQEITPAKDIETEETL